MGIMTAPSSGVKIRMYRQGHGDCFLLAFAGKKGSKKRPVYMLIDCGLKPGSEIKDQKIDTVIADIAAATGGFIDVVAITHEHQDHVNGFLKTVGRGKKKKYAFDDIKVGQVWLAWTEDGDNPVANHLRETSNDQLVALAFAEDKLKRLNPADDRLERISEMLDLDLGEGDARAALFDGIEAARLEHPDLSIAELGRLAITGIKNKTAIKYMRDKGERSPLFLSPKAGPYALTDTPGMKVYAFGPPEEKSLLRDLDPRDDEEFHLGRGANAFELDGATKAFMAAALEEGFDGTAASPFSNGYKIAQERVFGTPEKEDSGDVEYYRMVYGTAPEGTEENAWRGIGNDWFDPASALAIRINNEVNNTSLVMAFELPNSGKVLLFTGDAQRGNWVSWAHHSWDVDGEMLDARALLGRCVFYKCGHHGSHNATLNGTRADEHPNFSWFAQGEYGDEFVAVIPANTPWATKKSKPWIHPLPGIETALKQKAKGRVFRSDIDKVEKSDGISAADWRKFRRNTTETDLFFEYTIFDRPL